MGEKSVRVVINGVGCLFSMAGIREDAMKRNVILVSLLFAGVLFCGCVSHAQSTSGNMAHEFSLPDMNGTMVNLTDYRGKQDVIVMFWAKRCSICKGEIKSLRKTYPDLQKAGYELLAVNIEDSQKTLNKFFATNPPPFKVLLDEGGAIADIYQVNGIPTFVIVNKEGVMTFNGYRLPDDLCK